MKPIIGISCGDTNGIGPEIIMNSLSDKLMLDLFTPVIIGPSKVFQAVKKQYDNKEFNFQQIKSLDQINHGKVNLLSTSPSDHYQPGEPTEESGKNAREALIKAGELITNDEIDALVTAPIDKSNIQSDDFKFPGHTEFLGSLDPEHKEMMLMIHRDLRIAMYTGHIPISEVSGALNAESLKQKIELLQSIMIKDFGIRKPKVAVMGLNPHAGDNGLLGKEDQEIILPVIEEFKDKGNLVFGPFPADGFFGNQQQDQFDCILAIYHDQGLVPFKSLSFGKGINFTGGLKFIRTSPDHGTAFDIAGKGKSNHTSFNKAIFKAIEILKTRRVFEEASENPLKIRKKTSIRGTRV